VAAQWKRLACLAVFCLGCGAQGCSYVQARVADFADVFTFEATYGPGVDVHAQATGFFGTAVGYSQQTGVLVHGRACGIGERATVGMLLLAGTAAGGEDLACLGEGEAPGDRFGFWAMLLPLAFSPAEGVYVGYVPTWPRTFDVEAGFSAGVGVHVGVSPGELLDFVLGFTTLDIARDDEGPPPPREQWGPLPPLYGLLHGEWHPWWTPPP